MASASRYAIIRLQAIERELEMVRRSLLGERKAIKLEGLWEGVEISEEDLEQAKRSLFKEVYSFEGD
jgi:hypothetical protein